MKTLAQIRGMLKEGSVKVQDPPAMVILRRKAIRIFPSGQKVALYRNDKLNLDVSIPYYSGQIGSQATEIPMASVREEATDEVSLALDESIVTSLRSIMKKAKPGTVVFANGETAMVQPTTAKKLVDLHSEVNKKNREGLSAHMGDNPQDFKKVVDFTTTI